jgi:hypothetical protein
MGAGLRSERKDRRGFDLISERLPFGRLWYIKAADAVDYAKFYSRSHPTVIRVFDESGAVIERRQAIVRRTMGEQLT